MGHLTDETSSITCRSVSGNYDEKSAKTSGKFVISSRNYVRVEMLDEVTFRISIFPSMLFFYDYYEECSGREIGFSSVSTLKIYSANLEK